MHIYCWHLRLAFCVLLLPYGGETILGSLLGVEFQRQIPTELMNQRYIGVLLFALNTDRGLAPNLALSSIQSIECNSVQMQSASFIHILASN